jgi:hypothetical protein
MKGADYLDFIRKEDPPVIFPCGEDVSAEEATTLAQALWEERL